MLVNNVYHKVLLVFLSYILLIDSYKFSKLNINIGITKRQTIFQLSESKPYNIFNNINKILFKSDVLSSDTKITENFLPPPSLTIMKYFEYWNCRDMENASLLFSDDCIYEDTLYPNQFIGKDSLKSHLLNVASALPNSFQFKIDEISENIETGKVITDKYNNNLILISYDKVTIK